MGIGGVFSHGVLEPTLQPKHATAEGYRERERLCFWQKNRGVSGEPALFRCLFSIQCYSPNPKLFHVEASLTISKESTSEIPLFMARLGLLSSSSKQNILLSCNVVLVPQKNGMPSPWKENRLHFFCFQFRKALYLSLFKNPGLTGLLSRQLTSHPS